MATYIIDFEATNTRYYMASPLQFCALKIDESDILNIDKWEAMVLYFNYEKVVPPVVSDLTGLTNKRLLELSGGATFEELYHKYSPVFGNGNKIVGHNIKTYDMNLYNTQMQRLGYPLASNIEVVDTLQECKSYYWINQCENKKLSTVYHRLWTANGLSKEDAVAVAEGTCRRLGGSDFEIRSHNALYDCVMNAYIYAFGTQGGV